MKIRTAYRRIGTGLAAVALTLALSLVATPDPASAHARGRGGPRPPSRPGMQRPPIPPPDQSIQAIRDQLNRRGIGMSQATLDRLRDLDPRVLDAVSRGLWRVYGSDADRLTPEQRAALQGWLDNMIDHSGQIQAVLDSADWYNGNAWIAENADTFVAVGKGGVLVVAAVVNPGTIPVLIAIESAAGKAELGATALGEFTAALQDDFTVENAALGARNATIAVTVKVAGGKVANVVIPLDTFTTKAGNTIIKLGGKELRNATQQELRRAAAAWIGQELTKTGFGAAANRAGNRISSSGEPDAPMVSVSRTFDLPPDMREDVPVKTVTRTFDLPPEMKTPPAPAPTGTDDPIGRVIEQSLRSSGAAPPPAVESGLFDSPPTLPGPSPAPAPTGTSDLPADVAELFVNKMPSSFPPKTESGQIVAPGAPLR